MDRLPHLVPPRRFQRVLALLVAATIAVAAQAAPFRTAAARHWSTDRVIIKWRADGVTASHIQDPIARAASLSQISGLRVTALRAIRDRLDVVRLETPQRGEELRHTLARLRNDPTVEYAEPDARRYILAFPDDPPNDPRFTAGSDANGNWHGQWYLQEPASDATYGDTLSAIRATSAWKIRAGNPAVPILGSGLIIAVIDTGVDYTHPDLGIYTPGGSGTLLPGRDFICNDSGTNCFSTAAGNTFRVANDGDGWDADATDPGDWISGADLQSGNFNKDCGDFSDPNNTDGHIDSNWHGTRVAGIAAAITDNGVGIAGVAPGAVILPVRVIGKCGGYVSDIVAGMYWAAGLSNSALTGVPSNPTPAHILNLSLGASDSCSQTEQDAVNAITHDGHLIVAAAGNDGGPVGAPASCTGVLSVAGLRHVGTKVGYSNVSSTAAAISIAAPAGNCFNVVGHRPWTLPCLFSIETTSNAGLTGPTTSTYSYAILNQAASVNYENEGTLGTSFAAPIVSGVAALMVQANDKLTASELIARMQASATPFPVPASLPVGGICHVASLNKDAGGHYTDVQNAAECQCTTATCGAGMLNAAAAVAAALLPNASVVTSADRASVGQRVTLDGTGSSAARGYTVAAYHWSANPDVSIADAGMASASLIFPALRPVTITLTVTDDAGRQAQASKTIDGSVSASSTGSGSGSVDLVALAWLAGSCLLAITSRRRRQATAG